MRLGQQSLGTGRWRLSPLFGEGRRERVSLAAGTLAVLVFSQWTGAVGSWLSALACVALTCLVARYCLNRGTHDRAHYRRAWQILAIAAAVKGVWTCLHLTRIQVGVEALWEQAASEGWGALGFGALTIGFYVFSILALGQDRPGSHRGPLSIDVLLLLLGFVSIPMLILPALRSVPGCSEPHTDSLVGLMALGGRLGPHHRRSPRKRF